MTKYEVKELLTSYYRACREIKDIKTRIEIMNVESIPGGSVDDVFKKLNKELKNALCKADKQLACVQNYIGLLNDSDGNATVLRLYHIDGLSEKEIAKKMSLSAEYIRTKRWRTYQKIAKILGES